MPYVLRERREAMENGLKLLDHTVETPGDLNYAVCMLMESLAQRTGGNYAAQNAVLGAVEAAKMEYYRRVVAPYEDDKAWENGDVFGHRYPKEEKAK